jgi:carbonic anhydrase/acetyltransferase-like protein (isoleucine patch superfamily)
MRQEHAPRLVAPYTCSLPSRDVPIYALGGDVPRIHHTAFVHPDAVLIGNVTIGEEASVWPTAVLRGDSGGRIEVGARTSIQDGCVLHCTPELPTVVGDDCVIGHLVHLEGCTIEANALVGSGSLVLHRAVVRSWAQVAANAVVLNGMEVPSGALALGVPATIRDGRASAEAIIDGVASYLAKCRLYRTELRRVE